jgi:hypothetical protein
MTKALPDRNRNKTEYERKAESAIRKYVFKAIDKAKGDKITVQRAVDRNWKLKRKKHPTDPLNTHCVSKSTRKKEVDEIMSLAWGPFYKWIDKHKATIYRNFDDVYESLLCAIEQGKQRQREWDKKERQRKAAFHIEFVTDPESAMFGRLGTGMTDKQRYHLKDQLKGRKPIKRRKKFDPQRDEREQFLQGFDNDE